MTEAMPHRHMSSAVLTTALIVLAASSAEGQRLGANEPATGLHLDCGYRSPADWALALRAAVERGEISDPRTRRLPSLPVGSRPSVNLGGAPTVGTDDFFPFEDSAGLLLTNFSGGELIDLMVEGANTLLADRGDSFDFVGFWVNFTPHHTLGAAFYQPIENTVLGIGDPSTVGTPIFNARGDMGLAGASIEGFVMMWNINSSFWAPGTGSSASFTRLALGQEFEHRWALFLPDLLDGRSMQGDNGSCGRIFHWNWQIDGQGSCMELSDWRDTRPRSGTGGPLSWSANQGVRLVQNFVSFNTDTGGIFGYSDLYLMGYVTPGEMDAGNSELRLVPSPSCTSGFYQPTGFSSTDIIASAGPRIPDSSTSQKDFRTGWIIIHQPGSPPTPTQLTKAAGIMNQHSSDWASGTLGLGIMDNTLP
jgi:hypothetical protein